ncbi:MAG: cobalt ECF transporter T component CbiQ [Planctomycetota bacterium]
MHHREIERSASADTPVHRLDPRAKLVVVIAFTGLLMATSRYAVVRLVPFAILPGFLLMMGEVPLRFVVRALLLALPFVLCLAIANAAYDTQPVPVTIGEQTFALRGGWLSSGNILLRLALTISTLVALAATTPFHKLLNGMRRLGVPRGLCAVTAFLHRYLFLLADIIFRMKLARDLRSSGAPARRRLKSSAGIVASLLLRSIAQSERVYQAMLARGFSGEIREIDKLRMRRADWAFACGSAAAAVALFLYARAGI